MSAGLDVLGWGEAGKEGEEGGQKRRGRRGRGREREKEKGEKEKGGEGRGGVEREGGLNLWERVRRRALLTCASGERTRCGSSTAQGADWDERHEERYQRG
eukprot:1340460-Rhodomonas_salina.1